FAGPFRPVGSLRHQANMGPVRHREKGKAASAEALSAAVSTLARQAPGSGRLGLDRGPDDIKMDAATAGAAQGPVFGTGASRNDAQHCEAGVAIRAVAPHGRSNWRSGSKLGHDNPLMLGLRADVFLLRPSMLETIDVVLGV